MYFFILRKQYFLANFVKKNPFDLNIFLSHMKYGRKIIKYNLIKGFLFHLDVIVVDRQVGV